MHKLLIAFTLLAGACAPVFVPVPRHPRVFVPRPVVFRPAPPPVVVVPPPHVRVWW